jgi:hypothetical protein
MGLLLVCVPPHSATAHYNGESQTVRQSEERMKGVQGGRRLLLLAIAAVLGLSACRDSGLPDRNIPLPEARHRQYSFVAYQPAANNPPVAMAGRHWIRSLPVETIPAARLVPVGSAEGTQLYALRGARAPYSRLYAPVGQDRWAPYLRLN